MRHGFMQYVLSPGLQDRLAGFVVCVGCARDDGDGLELAGQDVLNGDQLLRQLDAIDLRHLDIRNHQAEVSLAARLGRIKQKNPNSVFRLDADT